MSLARRAAFNTAALVGGQIVQAVGGVLAIGLTSRYLGADRFGAFVTATTFFSLFQLTSEFGIGPVATRQLSRYPERKPQLLAGIVVLASLLGLAGGVSAIAASFAAYHGGNRSDITGAVVILSSQMVCAGPRAAALASITAAQRAYLTSASWIATRILTLGAIVVVVSADLGYTALVAAYAATAFLQTFCMAVFARHDLRLTGGASRQAVRSLFDAALPMGAVNVLSYLYFRLDLILLSFLSTPRNVALYGLAYKVIEMLMQLPAFVMATVMPELARRAAKPKAFLALLQRALDVMVLLALPVLLSGVFAEQLLTTIGGPAYADADTALRLLLFGLACAYVQTVFGHALVAQGLQALAFRVALVVLVVNLALNLALIPVAGIVGAGIALALSELLSLLLMWRRFGATGERPAVRLSVAQAMAGAAMLSTFVVVRWAGGRLDWPDAMTILLGGGFGSLAYGGVLMSRGALPVDPWTLIPGKRGRSSS